MKRLLSTLSWALAAWVSGAAWGSELVAVGLIVWTIVGGSRKGTRGWPDFILGAAVYLAAFLQAPEGSPVFARWSALAVAAVAVGSWRRPVLEAPDFALLAAAFLAAGSGQIGIVYPIAICLSFGLFFASEAWGRRITPRTWATGAGLIASGGALALGLALVLPIVQQRIISMFSDVPSPVMAGFSNSIRLGSFTEMIKSTGPILRLRGEHADYLRGRVYLRYLGGRWLGTDARDIEADYAAAGGATEVIPLAPVPAYFLPSGVAPTAVEGGRLRSDRTGIFRPLAGKDAGWLRFGGNAADLDPPEALALDVPERLRARLFELAKRVTKDATTDQQRMELMQSELQSFDYTLESPPDVKEPLIHFLFERRAGHCEYFASALTLMGRTLNNPTRVAAGFRVTEYNRLGDFYTIRGANAHAWTEAYIGGQWRRFDGTPSGVEEHMAQASTGLSAYLDALKELWMQYNLPVVPRWLALLLVGLGIVFLLLRTRQTKTKQGALSMPLALADYLAQLENQGEQRGPGEPLEVLARRLPDALAEPLWAYSAWAYGDEGSYEAVRVQLQTQAERLKQGEIKLVRSVP